MKRIGLIDVDYRNGNTFPNLALMKISAYHKSQGDFVEWYLPFNDRYDVVYVSKVFSFTEDYTDVINADKVIYGGTGYQIRLQNGKEVWKPAIPFGNGVEPYLPYEIEHIYPDYGLYPTLCKDTAYGYLTRGCPRGCAFCHVTAKEGKKSIKVANLSEFLERSKEYRIVRP